MLLGVEERSEQVPTTQILNIATGELRKYLDATEESRFVLVDVRQPDEYRTEHLPGAMLLPLPQLEHRLHEIPEDREAVIYCRSGNRSLVAARFLADSGMGPEKIYNVAGGINAWFGRSLQGFPKVRGFDASSSDEALIRQILEMEKGAVRFYKALAARLPESSFSKVVGALVRMEKIHARSAYDHWLDRVEGLPPFEELFEQTPGLVVEGGEALDVVLTRVAGQDLSDTLAIVELALDIELHAFDLYRVMANRTPNAKAQRAFLALAEQEKTHIRLVTSAWNEID
jgi:sulfur-carrier protein adenylyltransferase/sulfurtransferase